MAKKHRKGPPRYSRKPQEKPAQPVGVRRSAVPQSGGAGAAADVAGAARPSRTLSLTPLAPIIVRSGRPFDGWTGVDPARFPPPSTLAGCLRTAWARAQGVGFPLAPDAESAAASAARLTGLALAGPLLLRGSTVLLPKPADALYFGHGRQARCVRAEPRPFDTGCGADLPEGLLPVQLSRPVEGKPGPGPSWWAWQDWLDFRRGGEVAHADLQQRGWSPPAGDRRTHVAIDRDRQAAVEGRLFQTEGLEFASDPSDAAAGTFGDEPLRLLARCAEPLGAALVTLGGERRLAAMTPEPESAWPQPPDGWFEDIVRAGGLSLTLVTPAVFAAGYLPGWLDADRAPPDSVFDATSPSRPRLHLRAAAVDRWQPHSGWDLARQQPRPTRKLVPAGATYWFALAGDAELEALRGLWLASVCDDEQDRRDGFGLALPAPWTPVADSN
ncbi:CRISPR-associated protein Cmr3 [Thioalkalivibrio paradoxus ARh 1]|uniref:CRISPR-associated protein Cmr3 n=1 Tax=Thioalkalivibrio paradoxus ARh 1 TaxID=713585 RepID=W0DJ01_9GAMM|nr:CRISPR-associated protein Cmr3 [Thioalkalivibrio paradoxus ARh 1]